MPVPIFPDIQQLQKKTPRFNAFRKAAWDHHYQAVLGPAWTPTVADGKPLLLQASRIGEGIVGALVGSMWGGITGLEELVVHPDYIGHHVGTALVGRAATWTINNGGRALALSTGADWPAAKFYRALGFEEVVRLPRFYFEQDFIFFVKRLAP